MRDLRAYAYSREPDEASGPERRVVLTAAFRLLFMALLAPFATFVGEAVLIVWLLWAAIKGSRVSDARTVVEAQARASEVVA